MVTVTLRQIFFRILLLSPVSTISTQLHAQLLLHVALINILKPIGHVMHQQFNIQQLYVLPALYLCVLYSSESKQRLVPLIS
jgi:hypothetical protein